MKVVQFIVRASASNTSGSRRQLTYLGSREVKKQTGQFSTLCCRWTPSIQSLPLCSICLVHAELLPICSAPGTSSGVPVLTLRDKLTRGLERHSICFSRGIVETFGTPCGQEPTGMRPFNPKWSCGSLFETRTWGKRYSPFKICVSTNLFRKLRSITGQKVPYFFESRIEDWESPLSWGRHGLWRLWQGDSPPLHIWRGRSLGRGL